MSVVALEPLDQALRLTAYTHKMIEVSRLYSNSHMQRPRILSLDDINANRTASPTSSVGGDGARLRLQRNK